MEPLSVAESMKLYEDYVCARAEIKKLEAKLAESQAAVAAHESDHKIMGDAEVKYREEMNAKLAHWKKENDEAMNSIDELEQKLEKAEANAAQLLLIVKDMRTLVASGRLCSIGSEDNTYEVQVRSNVIQEWNNVINSSTAGAKLLAVVEAARKFDCWLDAADNRGGLRCDHVPERIVDEWEGCELALKALDGEENGK